MLPARKCNGDILLGGEPADGLRSGWLGGDVMLIILASRIKLEIQRAQRTVTSTSRSDGFIDPMWEGVYLTYRGYGVEMGPRGPVSR